MDVKHKAFLVWRDYNNYYNNVMNRLKLKLIAEHKRRLLCAFMRWKEGADQIFHLELMEMNETQQNENQDLVNELNKKNDVREQQKVQSGRQQQTKLERILNFVDRKRIRAFFKRWVAGAKKLDDLETALFKSSKTAYKKLKNRGPLCSKYWIKDRQINIYSLAVRTLMLVKLVNQGPVL